MPVLWIALVLGLVEGATEFLPVSSTGHLVLVKAALGFDGPASDAFAVVIQAGAMLAVVWLYRARFVSLLRPAAPGRFGGARGIVLLTLTTVPALAIGYALRGPIHGLFSPATVAAALAVGGVAILALERFRGDRGARTLDAMTPAIALGIGLFQCLALWPGFSRSAATLGGAMLLGLTRRAAAEWSFLAAVPVLLAASGYEALEHRAALAALGAPFLLVGFLASAVCAVVAVRAFTALLARATLTPFGAYRLVLAAVVAYVLVLRR